MRPLPWEAFFLYPFVSRGGGALARCASHSSLAHRLNKSFLPKSGSLDLTATNYWTGWVGMRLAVSKLKIDSIRPIYDRNGTFGTPLHAQTTIYPSGLP